MTAETQTPASESPKTNFLVGEEAIADEIRVVQSVQTQGNMPVLLAGNTFGVAIVLYVDWAAAIASHAIYFLIGVIVLLLPMLRSYLRLRTRLRPERVSMRHIRFLEIHSLLLGLVWAAAVFMVMSELRPIDGVVVSSVMLCMGFAAAALMPSVPKSSIAFIGPVICGTFIGLFANEVLNVGVLILLCAASVGSLYRTVWQSWRDVRATVRLGLEKLHAEAEAHHRETEAMRSMLAAIPFPLVLTRKSGALVVSATAARQFGIPAGDLDGINIQDFFVNPDDQQRMANLQTEQGRLDEYEVQLKNAQGEPF